MATAILNYSQSLIEVIINGLKTTLKGMMIGYMVGRQTSANTRVAEFLISTGEYRQQRYWEILNRLNRETIDSIHKEFNYK